MAPQDYKVINTHAHEISVWKILSIIIHVRAPNLQGMNGDVQSDLSTLELNNEELLEYIYSRTLILQKEIILYGETAYHIRPILQYMKVLQNSDKLKEIIAPNMTDLITFLDKNVKLDIYTGGDIFELYCYLEIIGSPTNLTASVRLSHRLVPSSSIKNDIETLQPVIAALCIRQNTICEWCGIIGHKSDS